jgi:hypothetical protein
MPTTPRTTERMMMRSRCWFDIGPVESDMADCEGERLEIELEGVDVEVGVEVEAELEVDRLLAALDDVPVPFD